MGFQGLVEHSSRMFLALLPQPCPGEVQADARQGTGHAPCWVPESRWGPWWVASVSSLALPVAPLPTVLGYSLWAHGSAHPRC